jgi:hypoxanthine phosphoribosyltransferase
MLEDIEKVLLDASVIQKRVESLAVEIVSDIESALDDGETLMIVPVLTGSLIFVADLVRLLPRRLRIDVVTVMSYPGTATESQGSQIIGALPDHLEGAHVLIVDDIFDTGRTVSLLREKLGALRPASLKVCVLLRKPDRAVVSEQPDYVGFDIPDEFVVGYGLDFDGHYRNLPCIGTLSSRVIAAASEDKQP